MEDDPMTQYQGDKIIGLLSEILSNLKEMKGDIHAIRFEVETIKEDVRSLELKID
jgi:hypothetical protein